MTPTQIAEAQQAKPETRLCRVIAKGGKYTRGLYENPSADMLLAWEFDGDTVQWLVPATLAAQAAQAQQPPRDGLASDGELYSRTSEHAAPDWHAGYRAGVAAGRAISSATAPREGLTDAQPKPFTQAQMRRLYDNSPEFHADVKSRYGFYRIVALTERAHGIGTAGTAGAQEATR